MTTDNNELMVNSAIPDYMAGYVGNQMGNEDVASEDYTLPRLEIIQALSAARSKSDPGYIEGADEGLLYNSLTRELYGTSVTIVPIAFKKEFLLWQKLEKGGGFGGAYPSITAASEAKVFLENPDAWDIVKTHQHIAYLIKENGALEEIAISMARSKLKVSVRFNSLIKICGKALPRFAMMYKFTGKKVTNKQNQAYYNYDITHIGYTPKPIFDKALKLYELFGDIDMKIDSSYDKFSDDGEDESFDVASFGTE